MARKIEIGQHSVDWETVMDMFGSVMSEKYGCADMTSFIRGIQLAGGKVLKLLEVGSDLRWDDLLLLPDGNVLFTDRHAADGQDAVTENPPSDVNAFVSKLTNLLLAKE